MDRSEALTEYLAILNDTEDWLSGGYRQKHAEIEFRLPPAAAESLEEQEPVSPVGAASPVPPAHVPPVSSSVSPSAHVPPAPAASQTAAFEGEPAGQPASLKQIADEVSNCSSCDLYLSRKNTVPGVGVDNAVLMIVTSPPYDGAGFNSVPLPLYEYEYLTKWLTALGLDPLRDIFITPAVKCRTPGGRPPNPDESAACSSYLRRQYKEVKPRGILALGDAACGALTGNSADFPALVGRDWTWGSVPALVLWTPAEVLASPGRLRSPVWESLKRLKAAWNALPGSQL